MPSDDPAVKTTITKKSATKIFVERFWADDVIKFSATYIEMPDALDDEDIGTKITLEEYETGEHVRDGIAIWYWENGNKWKEYNYENGWLHGSYKIFYKDGSANTIGERITTWQYAPPSPGNESNEDAPEDNPEGRIGIWEYYDEEGNKTETIWSE